nr:uncharacterized protein LOC109150699 isoform X6 [Ipomoea batatas]
MEPHNTDVDKSTADDDAVKELDEMEKRLKEMEKEAGGVLREMQAKVEKEMDAVQNPASDAASFSGKQGGKTVVRADIIEPRYCGCTTKSTVEGGPTPHQGSLAGGGSNKVIFAYKKRAALVADFLSLQFETDVRVAVIECWCCVLNEKEKYKRAYNPSRFFVSALTSIHTIVFATASRERRLRWFVKRLDGNFDIAPHINRCTVDLFFFPMSHAQHYFVLCVDMRNRKLEIIDRLAESDRTSDIYGEILKDLKDLLSSYLEKKGHPVRAATVRNLKPTRLRIGWRDCQNNVDCAVAMRQMETFMARPHSRWDCDLENGNRQLLRKLRQKYLHDIVMIDVNAHKEWIMECTTEYDN